MFRAYHSHKQFKDANGGGFEADNARKASLQKVNELFERKHNAVITPQTTSKKCYNGGDFEAGRRLRARSILKRM